MIFNKYIKQKKQRAKDRREKRKMKIKEKISKHNKKREYIENTRSFKEIVRCVFTYVSKFDLDRTRKLGKYGSDADYAKNKARIANGNKPIYKKVGLHEFSRSSLKEMIERLIFGKLRSIMKDLPDAKPTGIAKMVRNELADFDKNPSYFAEVDERQRELQKEQKDMEKKYQEMLEQHQIKKAEDEKIQNEVEEEDISEESVDPYKLEMDETDIRNPDA